MLDKLKSLFGGKSLTSKDWKTRREAVEQLAEKGTDTAIAQLVGALKDENGLVRIAVVKALLKLKPPAAADALMETIAGDENVEVVRGAMDVLAVMNEKRAVDALVMLLVDERGDVRRGAAKTLERLGEGKWRPLARGDEEDPDRVAKSGDKRLITPLLKNLDSLRPETRRNAARMLSLMGTQEAIEPIQNALVSHDPSLRKAMADALGKLGQPQWMGIFKGTVEDWERLSTSGEKRAVDLLVRALELDSRSDRVAAFKLLKTMKDPAAEVAVRKYEKDEKMKSMRESAAGTVSSKV